MADLETSWNDIHACFCLKSWVSFCQMYTHCMSVFKLKLNCSITPWHKVQFYRRVFHRFMHSISFPVVGVWLLYISTISSVAPLLGRICGNPSFHPTPIYTFRFIATLITSADCLYKEICCIKRNITIY